MTSGNLIHGSAFLSRNFFCVLMRAYKSSCQSLTDTEKRFPRTVALLLSVFLSFFMRNYFYPLGEDELENFKGESKRYRSLNLDLVQNHGGKRRGKRRRRSVSGICFCSLAPGPRFNNRSPTPTPPLRAGGQALPRPPIPYTVLRATKKRYCRRLLR